MRLIDADELKKNTYPFPCAIGVEYAVTLRAINEAPTIEIEKQGHWIKKYDSSSQDYNTDNNWDYYCSLCDRFMKWEGKYCPHCGAKME